MDASTSTNTAGTSMLRRLVYASGRYLEGSSVFQACSEQFPGANTTVLLECVADELENSSSNDINDGSDPWGDDLLSFLLTLSGALIFFMQTGFAMLCAGCVRLKNVQNTMLKNLLDACGSAVAFFLIGKSLERNLQDKGCTVLRQTQLIFIWLLFILGYTLAYGNQYTTPGTTFVGSGDWFATGPSPSYWFFGTSI
jgi:Ammonium Transporter Family